MDRIKGTVRELCRSWADELHIVVVFSNVSVVRGNILCYNLMNNCCFEARLK